MRWLLLFAALGGCAGARPRLHAPYPAAADVARLPVVDRVEIAELGDEVEASTLRDWRGHFPVDPHDKGAIIERSHVVTGAAAARFVTAWRALPFDDRTQYMCHHPAFGLRFYAQEQLVLQTTLCLSCWNFWDAEGGFRGIDFRKPAGQAFYARLREIVPSLPETMRKQPVGFDD